MRIAMLAPVCGFFHRKYWRSPYSGNSIQAFGSRSSRRVRISSVSASALAGLSVSICSSFAETGNAQISGRPAATWKTSPGAPSK